MILVERDNESRLSMWFERGCGLAYFDYKSQNSSYISLEGLREREYCHVPSKIKGKQQGIAF